MFYKYPPGKEQGSPDFQELWRRRETRVEGQRRGGCAAHGDWGTAIRVAGHLSYPRSFPGLDGTALSALTPPRLWSLRLD